MYDVEIDDQGLDEAESDAGGTIVVSVPAGIDAGVRVKLRRDSARRSSPSGFAPPGASGDCRSPPLCSSAGRSAVSNL